MANPHVNRRLLATDLDGTLHGGDLAFHCVGRMLWRQPWTLPLLLWWTCRGRLRLKLEVARRIQPDPAKLTWHHEVIGFLREEASTGRTLVLATAAVREHTDTVTAYLAQAHGLEFDRVLTSTTTDNLHGHAKAHALAALGESVGGFDYVGDSPLQDPPVFRQAHTSHMVNPTKELLQEFGTVADSRIFRTQASLGQALRRRLLALLQAPPRS